MRLILVVAAFLSICLVAGCDQSPKRGAISSRAPAPPGVDIEKLIDQLPDTSEPGFGYSVYFSGSEFLPFDEPGQISTGVLGGMKATRSKTLREIVRHGAAAVPVLLKRIGDKRPTKIPAMTGMMWIDFSDEYDFNRRTRPNAPAGVNRDDFASENEHPDRHVITVGDLCFVALGQIVNRNFSATRYQPSGGLLVSSPTYSDQLRKVILEDWSSLSPESHQQLLVEDFVHPDHEDRRIGAYLRLALYYPGAVDDLVVSELAKPTFDVFVIEKFCRDTLYKIADPALRAMAYEDFLRQHGSAFAGGIRKQLFDDFDFDDRFETRPYDLLVQLFQLPASITSRDRPPSENQSRTEQARFIASLIHEDSHKIGEAVRAIFLENSDDPSLAPACLRCLANRGYEDLLLDQLSRIDPAEREAKPLVTGKLESIATSRATAVRTKVDDIMTHCANEDYFMATLPGEIEQGRTVFEAAVKLLSTLHDDTDDGQYLLRMIGERFPNEARAVYKTFLSTGSAKRAETMCRVLWYGHPLAREILAPLLDDRRELSGFAIPMRVCDRAAQAISHTSKDIRFDSDWSREQKDLQIERLKKYCQAGVNRE
ncbi:MAG: hypothetical protein JSS02_13800 [Planctomycetes bacterium]|nr:hypothetical protein [Planctomycetota bacterium]